MRSIVSKEIKMNKVKMFFESNVFYIAAWLNGVAFGIAVCQIAKVVV